MADIGKKLTFMLAGSNSFFIGNGYFFSGPWIYYVYAYQTDYGNYKGEEDRQKDNYFFFEFSEQAFFNINYFWFQRQSAGRNLILLQNCAVKNIYIGTFFNNFEICRGIAFKDFQGS